MHNNIFMKNNQKSLSDSVLKKLDQMKKNTLFNTFTR